MRHFAHRETRGEGFLVSRLNSILMALLGCLVVQTGTASAKPDPLFESDEVLEMTLSAPLSTLHGDLRGTEDHVDATLTISGSDDVFDLKIRNRGITRQKKEICPFPPIRLNFKKGDMKGTIFDGQDKLKLVTHCHDRRSRYWTYYRQEYYAYRTYNLLTEESFRVRPATITYVDTDGRRKPFTGFAFIIESNGGVKDRTGLKEAELAKIPMAGFDPVKASRVALFEYLIGNLDFSTLGGPDGECCHNSKAFKDSDGRFVSVPYDFDFSGVVDADYATPPQGIELRDIKERIYRGFCVHNEGLDEAIDLFNSKRPQIEALYREAALLDDKAANRTLQYYDAAYKIFNDPKDFKRKILDRCRG